MLVLSASLAETAAPLPARPGLSPFCAAKLHQIFDRTKLKTIEFSTNPPPHCPTSHSKPLLHNKITAQKIFSPTLIFNTPTTQSCYSAQLLKDLIDLKDLSNPPIPGFLDTRRCTIIHYPPRKMLNICTTAVFVITLHCRLFQKSQSWDCGRVGGNKFGKRLLALFLGYQKSGKFQSRSRMRQR